MAIRGRQMCGCRRRATTSNTGPIEVVVDGNPANRDAAFDTLRLAIGTALAADRTLGGQCDYITPEAPEPVLLAIDGNEGLKAAVIPMILAH